MDLEKYKKAFLIDAGETIALLKEAIASLKEDPANADALEKAHRGFHTIKSTAGAMGFAEISELGKTHEFLLKPHFEAKTAPSSEEIVQCETAVSNIEKMVGAIEV